METYSRIGLIRSHGNLQSYWTSTKLYGNLQSYWTTTKLCKLTVVLDYYEAMETYSRFRLGRSYGNLQSYWTSTKLYGNLQSYWTSTELYGNLQSYWTRMRAPVRTKMKYQIYQFKNDQSMNRQISRSRQRFVKKKEKSIFHFP
jgi:hypothetical protein